MDQQYSKDSGSDDDDVLTEGEVAETVQKIWALYDSGTPLWTKSMLNDLEEQLSQNCTEVTILGIDGIRVKFSLDWMRDFIRDGEGQPMIDFKPIQEMVNGWNPDEIVERKGRFCSLSVILISGEQTGGGERIRSAESALAYFDQQRQRWEGSDACPELRATLASVTLPTSITKIVCFGLGSLHGTDTGPWAQHAAALTMAQALKEKTGSDVLCYVQDPAYSDICKQVLRQHRLTVLGGERGFAELDRDTLVFSVSPNVAVKQVVTDLARPAAIVWDKVLPVEAEITEWKRIKVDDKDEESWLVPYGTDPDSPRVRNMVQEHYNKYPFPKDGDNYSELEIYIRKK